MTQFCIHYFKEYQETCKNLVPVERVVYDVPDRVEMKSISSVLWLIWNQGHQL